ncbi:malate synthase A [Nesterenkonia halobia]|uniref:malate synthase n=1 Tax=Nesterenkonia halobia TaxID=37922 RepID=A0ABP6RJ61_9MICC
MSFPTTPTHSMPPTIDGVTVAGPEIPRLGEVLTHDALRFLAALHREFEPRRRELMRHRAERRRRFANGEDPGFLPETREIRENSSWLVAPLAPGLEDRRVEITGPVDRKMTINALNSGARCWLADFEDASTPCWSTMIEGQLNLTDALERRIDFTAENGKHYALREAELTDMPTIIVRPRGWHLQERHLLVDGEPMSGGLVDFGLHLFHNGQRLIDQGRGPYYYLPKIEGHLEAQLWDDIFTRAQQMLDIPHGTIRATVLIETITAAFEMEEILHALQHHSAGLNAGRWDYIFSMIKNFRDRGEEFVMPDRAQVTMTAPFMRAYTEQLVRACHRRRASAIGGMAAFIPDRRNPEATEEAVAKVREDKTREAADGFDGSWVAHPDLVPIVEEVFDEHMGGIENQIDRDREDVVPDAAALLDVRSTPGRITESGLRANIAVGIRYVESWLRGRGAAAIDHLMEDAATAEIARSQVWQWIRTGSHTSSGQEITRAFVARLVDEEVERLPRTEDDRIDDAVRLFAECALAEEFPEFLTLPGYDRHLRQDRAARDETRDESRREPAAAVS